MDIMSALKYRGPYEEAYQQSRESEIVNQQRVAQAQQMIQEARMKAEMQPYDIESKQAAAAFNRANAQKMVQEKPVNPKHTAEAQAQFQSILNPYVEAIQAETDPARREAMTQQLLAQAKEYNFPLEQFINSPAFLKSMGRSKEVAKLQHGAAQNATNVVIQDKRGASSERVATIRGQFAAQAAASKADKDKTPASYQAAAVKWAEAAANAETQEQYDKAAKMAQEYEAKAKAQASASATTTAGAKAEMVDRVLNPQQGRSGKIGDKGGGSPDTPKPKVYNPQTKRWE